MALLTHRVHGVLIGQATVRGFWKPSSWTRCFDRVPAGRNAHFITVLAVHVCSTSDSFVFSRTKMKAYGRLYVAFALVTVFAARASGWPTRDEIVQTIYQRALTGIRFVPRKLIAALLIIPIQTPSILKPFQALLRRLLLRA